MIQEKAMEFAALFGDTGFDASSAWLHHFRVHYGIAWEQVYGEMSSMDTAALSTWQEELRNVISDYCSDSAHSAEKTSVFYQLLSNRAMYYKDYMCKGGKHSKVRITVLFCCNVLGTHKMTPITTGHYTRPRWFKGLAPLPFDYTHNSKAWIHANCLKVDDRHEQ